MPRTQPVAVWKCVCGSEHADVVDSRATAYGVRRRRQCRGCGARFSTSERFADGPLITEQDAIRLCEVMVNAERLHKVLDEILRRKRWRGGPLSQAAEEG